MTATIRVEKTRRFYAECPFFEDEDADVSLINRFSEELFSLVKQTSENDPSSHYRLVCDLSESENALLAVYTLTARRGIEPPVRKRLQVLYKNGYIIEYKEI